MNCSELLESYLDHALSVPEGHADGSLARSAWERRTQGSVPLGYGVRFLPVSSEFARTLSDKRRCAATDSNRTLRDGFIAPLVPGTSCQATIKLSLRDSKRRFPTARVEQRSYDGVY